MEEVAELEEYISEIPRQTEEVTKVIEEMLHQFEVLDDFTFQLSDEQFGDKWEAYGWPRKIEDAVDDVQKQIIKDRQGYQDEMRNEQGSFERELDDLEKVITGFAQYNDINDIATIGKDVRERAQALREHSALAKKFQSRELLFGLEQTDYDRVARLAKQFEPFEQLWVSADDWVRWHKSWMEDPFDTLKPEVMEQDLSEAIRNVFKASKAFAAIPECQAVAVEVKKQMDEFKPIMPLVTALRNPGLRDRHWDKICEDLNFEVRPGSSLNALTDVYRLGLMDKEEALLKVCESAGKEYAIEAALDKMVAVSARLRAIP